MVRYVSDQHVPAAPKPNIYFPVVNTLRLYSKLAPANSWRNLSYKEVKFDNCCMINRIIVSLYGIELFF